MFQDFCFKYKKFIMDNLEFKSNLDNLIGDLLYLFHRHTNIEIIDYSNVINEIFKIFELINSNKTFTNTINQLQELQVSIDSIKRYKFLLDTYIKINSY